MATSAGLGLATSGLIAAHMVSPVVRLHNDPAAERGPFLASVVGRWALPDGAAAWEAGVERSRQVWATDPADAAAIWFGSGVRPTAPDCQRPPSVGDLVLTGPDRAPPCGDKVNYSRVHRIFTRDDYDRYLGLWLLYEVLP